VLIHKNYLNTLLWVRLTVLDLKNLKEAKSFKRNTIKNSLPSTCQTMPICRNLNAK
jgi:hypothetical protein